MEQDLAVIKHFRQLLLGSLSLLLAQAAMSAEEFSWGMSLAAAQTLEELPLTPQIEPPSEQDLRRPDILAPIPVPEELLEQQPRPESPPPAPDVPQSVTVSAFVFEGSDVFATEQLQQVVADYLDRPLTFTELFEVRDRITDFYQEAGYVNTVAIIPPQEFEPGGTVRVQIVEGGLEAIVVNSPGRLAPDYVSQRLERYVEPPLYLPRLLEGLQLLQLDPLIEQVSAELSAGPVQGRSLLTVAVTEADVSYIEAALDNARSPSVGSFQQSVDYVDANLFGQGERLSLGVSRTEGVAAIDGSYRWFLNPRNGTLQVSAGLTNSEVVEEPFDILEIESEASFAEVTWRQPLTLTPTEEFAIGLTASSQGSRSIFLERFFREEVGFPTPGADDDGKSRVSALRLFKEWIKQGPQQVFALRSQISLGLDVLGATTGTGDTDPQFLAWRGQGQWAKLLDNNALLVAQAGVQLADGPLLPLERLGLGGPTSVRGYRQNRLLVDNGLYGSVEARFPLYRNLPQEQLLQITPFLEGGYGWNSEKPDPDIDSLLSTGLGLVWEQGDALSARLDFGLPLLSTENDGTSLQESGVHLSFRYRFF